MTCGGKKISDASQYKAMRFETNDVSKRSKVLEDFKVYLL